MARTLPPAFIFMSPTASDGGWPLKDKFLFTQPTGEAQCYTAVKMLNFINALYFILLFGILFFSRKWL